MNHDRTATVPAPGVLGNDVGLGGGARAVSTRRSRHMGPSRCEPTAAIHSSPLLATLASTTSGTTRPVCSAIKTTVTITITNAAPTAANDSYVATTGVQLSVPAPGVLANDNDADGDTLTAVLINGGGNGSLNLLSNGGFTFKSGGGFVGSRTFTYRASDGLASSPTENGHDSRPSTSADTDANPGANSYHPRRPRHRRRRRRRRPPLRRLDPKAHTHADHPVADDPAAIDPLAVDPSSDRFDPAATVARANANAADRAWRVSLGLGKSVGAAGSVERSIADTPRGWPFRCSRQPGYRRWPDIGRWRLHGRWRWAADRRPARHRRRRPRRLDRMGGARFAS